MKTRQELIDAGKVWMVYLDASPDVILFEGTKTACQKFVKERGWNRRVRRGEMRMARLLWEKP